MVEIPAMVRHPLPKKMRVNQADLNRFGYTVGCAQCKHIQEKGHPKNGVTHDNRCTSRIMDELGQTLDGQARLRRYDDRVTDALARRLEEDVDQSLSVDAAEVDTSALACAAINLSMAIFISWRFMPEESCGFSASDASEALRSRRLAFLNRVRPCLKAC